MLYLYAKKILSALVLPPIGLVLLALWGVLLVRRHPRTGNAIAVFGLASLALLALPPVGDALMQSLEQYPTVSAQALSRVQAIVILSGDGYYAAPEYGADTVGRWTLERVRYGVQLQRTTDLPILTSGGAPFGGKPGAIAMKEVIEREYHGHVKWAETASRDTAENAAYSAAILKKAGISRIALVTQAWHLPRAVALFEHQGLEVIPAPTGFTTSDPSLFFQALPSASALLDSSLALHEWLGILVQRMRGVEAGRARGRGGRAGGTARRTS